MMEPGHAFPPFIHYPHIGNLDLVAEEEEEEDSNSMTTFPEVEWIVTEKIHGANMSLYINKERRFLSARRKGWLHGGNNLFKSGRLVASMEDAMQRLFKGFDKEKEEILAVRVFGELFGGAYPHPSVPKTQDKLVQTQIYYSAMQHFCAFDVHVETTSSSSSGGEFLDFDEAKRRCEEAGFMFTIPLFRGDFSKASLFDVEKFQTTIPALLGYPPFEDGRSSLAEGVVIRPAKELPRQGDQKRVIFKHKNDKFAEVTKQHRGKFKLTSDPFYNELICYCNENRLIGLLSKSGDELNFRTFGKLFPAFLEDVFDEFKRESKSAAAFYESPEAQRKQIRKNVQAYVAAMFKELIKKKENEK